MHFNPAPSNRKHFYHLTETKILIFGIFLVQIVSVCGLNLLSDNDHKPLDSTSILNRRHTHFRTSNSTSNSTPLHTWHRKPFRANKKRCRYSDTELNDFSASDNQNKPRQTDNDNYNPFSYVKSQRVRDQYQNRFHHHMGSEETTASADSGNGADQIETEDLLVNVGDTINLTCLINIKEVDWQFKDKNLTTTFLSFGPQLQVRQSIMYEADERAPTDYLDDQHYHEHNSMFNNNKRNRMPIVKYRVSSSLVDQTHMLTLYIQGSQDEGSYQCVDPKSDAPIKKTIRVFLSKSSLIGSLF